MPTKIRLQRHGKKGKPFYYIVAADSRSKRDGRYIERFGSYNPNTNPATIEMDFDRALYWVKQGAEPTDTMRAMLSYRGVMYKSHLDRGVLKEAFTQEEAEKRFAKWMDEKQAKIDAKTEGLAQTEAAERAKLLVAEKAVSDARAAAQVATPEAEATEEASAEATASEEAPVAEATTEDAAPEAQAEVPDEAAAEASADAAPEAEAPAEEAPQAEAAEEAPKAEAAEEVKAEEAPEAPAEESTEEPKAEAPASEEASEEEEKKD